MAAFTSVSLMSTSAWNGPGGSPIISPSRWNALVASNLAVYDNHNHAASAGEGASQIFSASHFPSLDVQYIYPWFPITNNGWILETSTSFPGMGQISTSTLGAVLEYDVYIRPGTWQITILYGYGQGIWAASLGGSPIIFSIGGTVLDTDGNWAMGGFSEFPDAFGNFYGTPLGNDLATASYTHDPVFFTTQQSFANIGNGRIKLKFKLIGKNYNNFSSSPTKEGYIARLGYMMLYRTGAA